jgi:hypothetical protein
MGFQDAFDESLAEYFFETFYSRLAVGRWIVPDAFEQAWAATRLQVDLVPGTGIALWARTPLIDPQATHRLRAAAPSAAATTAVASATAAPPAALIEPKEEINYAVLHNAQPLFEKFVLECDAGAATCRCWRSVAVHMGPETRPLRAAEVELTMHRLER